MLRKEAIQIEIFENDRGDGRFGLGVGTWGLCATQGGGGPSSAKRRKIVPLRGNLLWAISPKRPGRFRPGLFFMATNGILFLLASCIRGRGHATNDLPRVVRSSPRVRNPQSVGPDSGA